MDLKHQTTEDIKFEIIQCLETHFNDTIEIKREALKIFLFNLKKLYSLKKIRPSNEIFFELNQSFEKVVKNFEEVKVEEMGNILKIKGKMEIFYDIKYGVIHSSKNIENLKFEKNIKKIMSYFLNVK